MPNEDEAKRAEAHPLQETARTLEEKIFDAKDATLRLWERNRQLQHRVGGLERRVRVLTWLALGLMLGSIGLFAVIAQGQVAPLQRQIAALQETVSPLPARLEELAGTLMARANTAAAMSDDGWYYTGNALLPERPEKCQAYSSLTALRLPISITCITLPGATRRPRHFMPVGNRGLWSRCLARVLGATYVSVREETATTEKEKRCFSS